MEKKQWILVAIVLALAGVYVIYFTDWFRHKNIQIHYTSRPLRLRFPPGATLSTVTFGFDKAFRLTEIKVVPLAAFQTNQNALPIWHLVSNSKSEPVERFIYGQNIRGMKSAVAGTRAEPLQSNVIYRLFVAAGSLKGREDFQLGGKPSGVTNQTASP